MTYTEEHNMEHRFESHGLLFVIEGSGFMNARDDLATTAEKAKAALDAMPAADVSRIHAGCLAATDSKPFIELDELARRIKAEVTADWYNANNALVWLVAVTE
jgi:hypothetical protein